MQVLESLLHKIFIEMSRFLTRGLKGSLVITDLGMDRLTVN